MFDPFIGSLIGLYGVVAVLVGMWLALQLLRRLARRFHIDSGHWAAGTLMVLCFYLALLIGFAWPVLLVIKGINRRESNVRS